MKSKEVKQDIKLGIFVLAGLSLFIASVFMVGSENNVFNRTFTTHAVFNNVEGLKEGDNVWLSGVKIGTVREVKIIKEGEVVVTLNLKENQNRFIKRNATAFIGSDGLVGNKIVVIKPGDAAMAIQDTDTIGASNPADTQQLFEIAKEVGDNTRSLTNDLRTLAKRVTDGQGLVGELMTDGEFARDLRNAAHQINRTTAQTAQASQELHAMLYKLNHGDGIVNKLASDTSLGYAFEETMHNVKELSKNSAELSKGIEELVVKMNNGNNAVGVLLADTAFADRLRITLENAHSASAKLDENMEAMQHNFLFRGYFRKKEKEESEGNK